MPNLNEKFIESILQEDEKVIERAHISIVGVLLDHFFIKIACIIGFFLLKEVNYYLMVFPLLVLFKFLLSDFIYYYFTIILVTNKRLFYKTGFFTISVLDTDLEKIELATVNFSFVGRMLDYGYISTKRKDFYDMVFSHILQPIKFKDLIQKESRAKRKNKN